MRGTSLNRRRQIFPAPIFSRVVGAMLALIALVLLIGGI